MPFLSLLLLPVPLLLLPPITTTDPGSRGNSFSLGSITPIGTPTPTGPDDNFTSSIPFSIAAAAVVGKYGFPEGAAAVAAENGWWLSVAGGENTLGDGKMGGSWEAGDRADEAETGDGSHEDMVLDGRSSGNVPARLGRGGGIPFPPDAAVVKGGGKEGFPVEYLAFGLGDPL